MVIRNISSKIIGIAGTVLMPDGEMTVNEDIGNSEPVRAIESKGFVKVIETPVEVKAAAAEVPEKPKRTYTRHKKIEETEESVETEAV